MPLIHPPHYTKITHPDTRVIEACYTFRVTMDDEERLSHLVEEPSTLEASMMGPCLKENHVWWEEFLRLFLERSSKFFSRAYTVRQLLPMITHSFSSPVTISCPSTIWLSPARIQIRGGGFCVFWEHECEPLVIDIPVATESLPVDSEDSTFSEPSPFLDPPDACSSDGLSEHERLDSSVPVEVLEEFSLQEIPLSSTESAAQLRDRQKAKEARLKAKVAIYRAQSEMNQYYNKYGKDLTDSDASDSDSDSDTESVSSRK